MAMLSKTDLQAKAEKVGITGTIFSDLWTKYGPLVLTFLIQFLQQVAAQKAGMKAAEKVKCDPGCLAKLDAAIEALCIGACGVIQHRECCCCDGE